MGLSSCLPGDWYERDPVVVARELLGMRLVRVLDGQVLSGIISETEAYRGEEDLACHARVGRTARTAVMYGHGGVGVCVLHLRPALVFERCLPAGGVPGSGIDPRN